MMCFFKKIVPVLFLFSMFILFADETDREDLHEIDIITYTGTGTGKRLKDSPIITEVISRDEINNSGAVNLTGVLENYGLMFNKNAMGSYISLQGLGESRIQFLIDGRKVTGRVAKRLDTETISVENIERIEIIKGPQSALYGSDAMGGVINIITRKDSSENVSGNVKVINSMISPEKDANFFKAQTVSGNLNFGKDINRNTVYFNFGRSDYYLNDNRAMSITPRMYTGKAGADINFDIRESDLVSFGGSVFNTRTDDQVSSSGSFNRKDTTRADVYLTGDFSVNEYIGVNYKLYHNYYKRVTDKYIDSIKEFADVREEEENYTSGNAFVNFYIPQNYGHYNRMTLGFEGSYNRLSKYNIGTNSEPKDRDFQAVIIQDEQSKDGLYSVVAGVRFERDAVFGFFATPKVSAMFIPFEKFRIFTGVGLGYRAPDFSDLYLVMDRPGHPVVLGNTSLIPEKSIGFNAGMEYSHKTKLSVLSLQGNFFYNELFDEMVNVETVNTDVNDERRKYIKENVDRSFNLGTDLEVSVSIMRYFTMTTGYGYIYAFNRTFNEEINNQPAHTVRFRTAYNNPELGLVSHINGRYLSPVSEGDLGLLMFNFYLSKEINKYLKPFISVDNITNAVVPQYGDTEGRSFTLGMEVVF